ncbi:MAG: 1,4-dihydroxy-6-naphthoate synthase [Magnetococcales bacterium]|nr:1,4-dihydroxy-6-naphthoate synthase [Magnetococcales bacterium]
MHFSLAFSPCPNDTFLFGAIALGLVQYPETDWKVHLLDIETLNRSALDGSFDVTKLSVHAWMSARHQYTLLHIGGAFTDSEGPVVVANRPCTIQDLAGRRLVFPGRYTTAYLLYRMLVPGEGDHHFLPYDRIAPAIASGAFDAGVIIHETRFTFADHGLEHVLDLGRWWRQETGLPLPLGCCAIRSSLHAEWGHAVETLMKQSLSLARHGSSDLEDYMRRHACEMAPEVLDRHVRLFVNRYTEDFGDRGWMALCELESRAHRAGLLS